MASAPDRFKRVSMLSEPSWLGRPCRFSHQDRSSSASWGNPQRALGSCCNAVQKPSSSLHHIDPDHGHTGRLRSYGSAEVAKLTAYLHAYEGLLRAQDASCSALVQHRKCMELRELYMFGN